MFVRQATYNKLRTDYAVLAHAFNDLKRQWNELVTELNEKGGRQFIDRKPVGLDDHDLKTLIKLCHPDKHNGAQDAHAITVKLLALRNK